jgi:uncharacterized protein (TIGR00725 family)
MLSSRPRRSSFSVRSDLSRATQISVFGASVSDGELNAHAAQVGQLLAEAGVTLVCGGRDGIMSAAAEAAREAGGQVIGILRGDEPDDANPHCTHVVATGIGNARNLAVAASGDATIAIGGEWGTLSEIAFARRLGRTVVLLDSWSLAGRGAMAEAPGIERAETPAEAVRLALDAAAARGR